jgi:uncharacterized membrane protein YkgB
VCSLTVRCSYQQEAVMQNIFYVIGVVVVVVAVLSLIGVG